MTSDSIRSIQRKTLNSVESLQLDGFREKTITESLSGLRNFCIGIAQANAQSSNRLWHQAFFAWCHSPVSKLLNKRSHGFFSQSSASAFKCRQCALDGFRLGW